MENQQILTVSERLKKNDRMIFAALAEKHQILAELLNGEVVSTVIAEHWLKINNQSIFLAKKNTGELDKIADQMIGLSVPDLKQRNSKELAMSAIGYTSQKMITKLFLILTIFQIFSARKSTVGMH